MILLFHNTSDINYFVIIMCEISHTQSYSSGSIVQKCFIVCIMKIHFIDNVLFDSFEYIYFYKKISI